MAPTIQDIAELTGVTKTTVSLVLNKKKSPIRISQATQDRVLKTADELGYHPSFAAKSLASGRTFTLGFFCPAISSPFFSSFAAKVMFEAENRGYHLTISTTEASLDKELECVGRLVNQKRVDGIFVWSYSLRPGIKGYHEVIHSKFPMVFAAKTKGFPCVYPDWHDGMTEAIGHLKNRGCDRVGFVGRANVELSDGKQEAFWEACSEHGIEPVECDSVASVEQAVQLGRRMAGDPDHPHALVVFSDHLATGVIDGLMDAGLRVPDDVAVIGIDGTDMGKYFRPSLTSIAQDTDKLVVGAIDLLLKTIESGKITAQEVSVPTKLVVRTSA